MTPLDPARTRHAQWFRRDGRTVRQLAEAASADGVWLYHREDDGGTTWTVVHVPSGRACPLEPSLRQARIGTATGWTLRELDRLDAQRAKWAELAGASA
jgi:hypothetical protein